MKTSDILPEKLSLDLISIYDFCQNVKSFSNENSMLRIHTREIHKNLQCAVVHSNSETN